MTTLSVDGPLVAEPREPGALQQAFDRIFRLDEVETTELLLIRHAEPDYNAGDATERPGDPPLMAAGRNQAMRLAVRLRTLPVDAIYASTRRRARETAAFVAAAKDMPVATSHDLREIDFDRTAMGPLGAGSYDTALELARRFVSQASWDSLPGFEPARDFRRRVLVGLEAIVSRHPGERVVVVAHGGVINAYLSTLLNIPRDMFFLPEYTSITTVRVCNDLYALRGLNDHAHLNSAAEAV